MTYGSHRGLGLHYGANAWHDVIPASAANSKRQVQLIQDFAGQPGTSRPRTAALAQDVANCGVADPKELA